MTTKDPRGTQTLAPSQYLNRRGAACTSTAPAAEGGTRGPGTTVAHDQGKKCGGACLAAVCASLFSSWAKSRGRSPGVQEKFFLAGVRIT